MKRRLLSLLMLLAAFLPLRLSAADTQQLTDEDYNRLMESGDAGRVVFIDFYADWCGPCKRMLPVVDALAGELAGQTKIVKLNVDESPQTAGRYNVMSIPTFIVFRDGKPVQQKVGGMSKEELAGLLR